MKGSSFSELFHQLTIQLLYFNYDVNIPSLVLFVIFDGKSKLLPSSPRQMFPHL